MADELVEALEGVVAVAQDSGKFLRSVAMVTLVIFFNSLHSGTQRATNLKIYRQWRKALRGVQSARGMGWVDLNFECPTVCLILPGLMEIWQKWLEHPKQSQPNPGPRADGTPCRRHACDRQPSDLAVEHDALGLVRALGDVVLLPLVGHDLPRHAEGCRGHQDPAARDGGRHAHAGQREAAPGGEGGQAEAEEGQRAALHGRVIQCRCL